MSDQNDIQNMPELSQNLLNGESLNTGGQQNPAPQVQSTQSIAPQPPQAPQPKPEDVVSKEDYTKMQEELAKLKESSTASNQELEAYRKFANDLKERPDVVNYLKGALSTPQTQADEEPNNETLAETESLKNQMTSDIMDKFVKENNIHLIEDDKLRSAVNNEIVSTLGKLGIDISTVPVDKLAETLNVGFNAVKSQHPIIGQEINKVLSKQTQNDLGSFPSMGAGGATKGDDGEVKLSSDQNNILDFLGVTQDKFQKFGAPSMKM